MKLPSLVRVPKHKRFDYRPRVYSPIKERQDQRRQILANKHGATRTHIKESFQQHRASRSQHSKFRWLMVGIFCMLMFSFVYQTWWPLYITVASYFVWKILRAKKSTTN